MQTVLLLDVFFAVSLDRKKKSAKTGIPQNPIWLLGWGIEAPDTER